MRTCLTVKMASSELSRLDREAKKHRLTRSAWVRSVLNQAVSSEKPSANWAEHWAWHKKHARRVETLPGASLDSQP